MSTAFLTTDFSSKRPLIPGGCAYYRCYLPAMVLRQRTALGIPSFNPIHGWGVKQDGSALIGFKNVMLKLLMHRETPKQIELAQNNAKQRIVVDIDDFYEGLTEANAAYRITHPDANKRVNRDHYKRVIEAADAITVSTPFLYDHYSKQRDNVYLVRNGINTEQFTRWRSADVPPIIGWTGSTRYRNSDLEQLREWLPDFLEEHDLRFLHVGHDPEGPAFSDLTGIDRKRLMVAPIAPITRYADFFTFDIGIVPLNDIPFNHAKSNIKGLEYAAAGIPFVASDLPEYRRLADDGVGMIARTPSEWVQQMTSLLNYKYRKTQAGIAHSVVNRKWSIDARANEWNAVFSD